MIQTQEYENETLIEPTNEFLRCDMEVRLSVDHLAGDFQSARCSEEIQDRVKAVQSEVMADFPSYSEFIDRLAEEDRENSRNDYLWQDNEMSEEEYSQLRQRILDTIADILLEQYRQLPANLLRWEDYNNVIRYDHQVWHVRASEGLYEAEKGATPTEIPLEWLNAAQSKLERMLKEII